MAEFSLVRDCPPGDEAAWRTLVQEALKGAPLASLRSSTYDGIATEPLYSRAEEAKPIAGRAAGAPWAVTQRIDLPDPAAANAQILEDLNNGANGIALVFPRPSATTALAFRRREPRSAPHSTASISMPAWLSISISARHRRMLLG